MGEFSLFRARAEADVKLVHWESECRDKGCRHGCREGECEVAHERMRGYEKDMRRKERDEERERERAESDAAAAEEAHMASLSPTADLDPPGFPGPAVASPWSEPFGSFDAPFPGGVPLEP